MDTTTRKELEALANEFDEEARRSPSGYYAGGMTNAAVRVRAVLAKHADCPHDDAAHCYECGRRPDGSIAFVGEK